MIPETLIEEFIIRNCMPEDHPLVIDVIKNWWGGRDLTYALPRLFFDHFNDSSFVILHGHQLVAFLIGFLSQSIPNEGYIHFVGVHPSFRKIGLGSHLYSLFFDHCRAHNRTIVKS
jgi:GNAT superfamily N-acetyltransferase